MESSPPINSRDQAKRQYYQKTGKQVRVPEYQTNFLQPPQVAHAMKPPSLHKKGKQTPIFKTTVPPDPKKLWNKPLKPDLQRPRNAIIHRQTPEMIKQNREISRSAITGSVAPTNQSYIPEISESQRLSNTIYNSVVKSQSHLVPFINQAVIAKVLGHYQIDNKKNKLDRDKITKLLDVFNEIASKLRSKELLDRDSSGKDIAGLPSYGMGAVSGGQAVHDDMYDRETQRETHTVCIDSNDRYRQFWPNSNEYQILFGRESSSNSKYQELTFTQDIQRTFHNVEKVALKEVIIPYNKNENYHKLPYLLLEIKELGSNFWGSNAKLSQAFAKLTVSEQKGDYLYYRVDVNEKRFNPRIELSSLSIRFLDPEGKLIDFGIEADLASTAENSGSLVQDNVITITDDLEQLDDEDFAAESTPIIERHNLLTFEITCVRRVFQSVFLH